MADFKEGDVVRCISDSGGRVPPGSIGVVVPRPSTYGGHEYDLYVRWFDGTLDVGAYGHGCYPMYVTEVERA